MEEGVTSGYYLGYEIDGANEREELCLVDW